MARYRITGPDGATYEVTAPDGASQEDVMAYVQANHQQAQPKAITPQAPSPEQLARQTYDSMPAWQRTLASAGAEFTSLGRGIGQLVTPNDSAVHQRLTAAADAEAPQQDAQHGVTNFAGRALPYVATALIGGPEVGAVGRSAGAGARIAAAAGEGAAYGAAQETRTGQSRTQNALIGAGLGAAGSAAGAGLVKYGKASAEAIAPDVRQVWQKAKSLGIDLTPAQLSNSRLVKFLSDQFGVLPFSGGAATRDQQVAQFNRQVANTIGVDAPVVTPAVYAAKKAADSAKFNDLTARNNLTVTPDLVRNIQQIAKEADIAGVGDSVRKAAEGLYGQMSADGQVPGAAYQALDSALGQATKSGDTTAHFVGRVRGAIRDAMDASISPEDQAAWQQLRQEYGDRKTIRDLVAKGNGAPLSPQQLMARVTATNAGKERMASGTRGTLGDLASVGQAMKPPPSSGTAERTMVRDLANPFMWPMLGLSATVGRVANSPALARLIMRDGRGQATQQAGRVLQRSPVATPALLSLLMGQQQPPDAGNGP